MRAEPFTLTARFLFPVEGEPIADGCLTIDHGRIAAIGPARSRAADLDLGNVAIIPGFVNTHTHLELDTIEPACLGSRAEDEVSWLRRVVAQRRDGTPEARRETIRRNVRRAIEAGTTTIADTTTAGASWCELAGSPLRSTVFAELIGLKRGRGLEVRAAAWDWLAAVRDEGRGTGRARPGLSPHAPYSTAGWLYHEAAASALPLSTHLAEMPEELELLETRGGPLRRFLEDLGAWDDDWEPLGTRPGDYFRRGELRRADWLIAHGTYLDPTDYWQLRPEAGPGGYRVALSYCPRTHARFGHAPHPYRALLERGVVVCVGTDSLASSPSLSLLDEVRFLHARDPSLGGPLLLTMATLFGAWAVRSEDETGSLKAGKSADLAVIPLPDRDVPDPHALVFESELPVEATLIEGECVAGALRMT